MSWTRAISLLDYVVFGVCIPLGVAATVLYAMGSVPVAAASTALWTVMMGMNWWEFRRWKNGQHRLIRESASDRDEFSRQVFMAKCMAASRFAAQINRLELSADPEARQASQALYDAVAQHPLPEDAEPHLVHLQASAARIASGGMPRELLH